MSSQTKSEWKKNKIEKSNIDASQNNLLSHFHENNAEKINHIENPRRSSNQIIDSNTALFINSIIVGFGIQYTSYRCMNEIKTPELALMAAVGCQSLHATELGENYIKKNHKTHIYNLNTAIKSCL